MKEISPLAAVTYSCLIGGAMLFAPACMEGLFTDVAGYRTVDWLGITYLGFFGSVLGFTWFYEGIDKLVLPSGNYLLILFLFLRPCLQS